MDAVKSLGTAPSNRRLASPLNTDEPQTPQEAADGGAAPNDPPVSPVMLAAMKAHRSWAQRYAPWLLEDWLR